MTGYEVAKTMKGLHEVKNNAELKKFMKSQAIIIDPAQTAWCAAFVNACERAAGKPGNGRLNARSFLTYGKSIYDRDKKTGSIKDYQKGDICVFERGGSTWMGHVAYIDALEGDLVRTLGGNQSDAVTIGWYPVSRLLGIRRL